MATATFDSTKTYLFSSLATRTAASCNCRSSSGWVWDDAHIKDLIASVAKGFPIGAVTLMETGGDVRFKADRSKAFP